MTDGVSLVVRAWLDEGRNPAYHRAMKRKLGREWPSLYAAVETLVRERTVTEADCPCWGCQSRTTEKDMRTSSIQSCGSGWRGGKAVWASES